MMLCCTAITARSGIVGILRQVPTTRLPPIRAAMRSISAASSSLSWTLASRSRCCCTTISVAAGGQPDQIEAEAGIEGIIQRVEPFAKQAVDHLSFRHRASGIDRDRAHRAVRCGKKLASSRRAPLPCLSIAVTSMAASADRLIAITVSVVTGSGKRFSTM